MIAHTLPRRIRLIPGSAIFTANFNTPTLGKYDFNGQRQTFVFELVPNSVYLLDSITIGGNVSGESFLDSIKTTPVLNIQKTNDNENIFDKPFPIQGYWTDRQVSRYFKTGLNNCGLQATLTGVLNQIPDFVGIAAISLSINMTLYGIDAAEYERLFTKQG